MSVLLCRMKREVSCAELDEWPGVVDIGVVRNAVCRLYPLGLYQCGEQRDEV